MRGIAGQRGLRELPLATGSQVSVAVRRIGAVLGILLASAALFWWWSTREDGTRHSSSVNVSFAAAEKSTFLPFRVLPCAYPGLPERTGRWRRRL